MRHVVKVLAIVILVLGAILVLWLFYFFPSRGIILTPSGATPDMPLTGEIGDFVGGVVGTVFSFAATLLVVVTLQEQRWQNKRNLFVQNYYEMLHLHADHVLQMTMHRQTHEILRGRAVFPQLIKHYDTIYDSVDSYIQHILNGGVDERSDACCQKEYLLDDRRRKLLTMRLTYGYFFYGTESYCQRKDTSDLEKTIDDTVRAIGKSNQFYVEGCHLLLAHYFRHMYQMVQYIINADCLSEDERYVFAKQLRAQMDDDEQLLLYYNAMSDVGSAWLESKKQGNKVKKIKDSCPLVRFRMIKNIPVSANIKGIAPEDYFNLAIDFFKNKHLDFFEQRS